MDTYILTGDVMIIDNNKLRNFSQRDHNIERTCQQTLGKIRSDQVSRLEYCIGIWCNKHVIHKSKFREWKQNVLTLVDNKILELST